MIKTFLKGDIPKVNVLVRFEFELVYFVSGVEHCSHYTTKNPSSTI